VARKDWYYAPIPVEMADTIDKIIDRDGKKYGIPDKIALIRTLLSDFISRYEEEKNIILARKAVRTPNNTDAKQPSR
jgi:hypothetical protein